MLIKIKNRMLPTIGVMHDIALRYIFDRPSVTSIEQVLLEEGIDGWTKKIDITPSEKWEIKRIVNALVADEKGFFNRAKELIKKWKITYRDLYKSGLPYVNENRKNWTKN